MFSFLQQNGVIRLKTSSSKTLISSCSFFKNNANADGGSLYILNDECVQSKICCTFSSASNFGGFSRVESSGRKFLFESSISSCSASLCSFYHLNGNSQINNINSSFHDIWCGAGYAIESPSVESNLNFSTVINCSSSYQGVVYNALGVISIKRCNYMMNKMKGTDGVLCCDSTTSFTECCFINNTGNKLFDNLSPTVTKCYFDNKEVSNTGNAIIVSTTGPFDLHLSHFSTGNCEATNISIKEQEDEDDIGVHPKYIKGKIEMLKNSSIIQLANITMS